MALREDIRVWDGRTADDMLRVFTCHHLSGTFTDDLLTCLHEPKLQAGATWLLKRHLDDGGGLSAEQVRQFLLVLPSLDAWGARLHALQCLHHLDIPSQDAGTVERFLRDCLREQNKFVRAWAYSGFHHLAQQHHEYRAETDRLLNNASESESASVQARIRRLMR